MGRLPILSHNLFLTLILLCAAAGVFVIYWLRRGVEEDDGSTTEADLLKGFELAYYHGEMDEAEFHRVTDTIKAKRSAVPAPPKPPATPIVPPVPSVDPPG